MNTNFPIKMRMRKCGRIVEVYSIYMNGDHTWAVTWDSQAAANQNGHGWGRMRLKELIPIEHSDEDGNYLSNQKRKDFKVKLTEATFETSDGKQFNSFTIGSVDEAKEATQTHQKHVEEACNE